MVEDKKGVRRTIDDVDNIIVAIGVRPYDILSEKISATVPEVHVIGDARQARSALEAIREGAEVARAI